MDARKNTTHMKPTVKKRWLAALRSGRYAQGYGCLVQPGLLGGGDACYCCLGVLCAIAPRRIAVERGGYYFAGPYGHALEYLPIDVWEWAGLTSKNPIVRCRGRRVTLATLNDQHVTFAEIADAIDRSL